METDVYFHSHGQWFKTKVRLPDTELTGAALAGHLWKACGFDPEQIPVFKVRQSEIARNSENDKVPVHENTLGTDDLVLNRGTYNTLKVQPGGLEDQALVVFLPTPWGSSLAGPWLASPAWAPCEKLYAYYDPDQNHPFIHELASVCHQIWPDSPSPPEDASQPLEPSHHTQRLYLLEKPPKNDSFNDTAWLQDQFQTGHCCDFGKAVQPAAALHLPRKLDGGKWPLRTFVLSTLSKQMHVCNDVFFAEQGAPEPGQNYGGNLLVSPPVQEQTEAFGVDAAGPAVKAHPPAPLGKLVVGDSKRGPMAARLRQFLTSQRLQPVLPIDTSWLAVGHVDEIVAFLRTRDCSSNKVLMADPGRMFQLYKMLEESEQKQMTTCFPYLGISSFQDMNDKLQAENLMPIRERLRKGLALAEDDFIPVPVAFVTSGYKASAYTFNLVNLQFINGHALIPKPLGPRVKPSRASELLKELGLPPVELGPRGPGSHEVELALEKAMEELEMEGVSQPKISMKEGSVGYWAWARKGTRAEVLAEEHARALLEEHSCELEEHAACALKALLQEPRNLNKFNEKHELQASASGYNRLWIPSSTVDLLECYMRAVLEPLGQTVHFLDTSAYHALHGELHCGTNAQRSLFTDWSLEKCQQQWREMLLHDLSYQVD